MSSLKVIYNNNTLILLNGYLLSSRITIGRKFINIYKFVEMFIQIVISVSEKYVKNGKK